MEPTSSGIPTIFGDMSRDDFDAMVAVTPFGKDRLNHPAGCEQAIYARGLFDLAKVGNPISGYHAPHLLEDVARLIDHPRALRVCMAFIMWFGTQSGQMAIRELRRQQAQEEDYEYVFQKSWHGDEKSFHYQSGVVRDRVFLDKLLNDSGPGQVPDFATPDDADVARALMEWLDGGEGTFFVGDMQQLIKAEYDRRHAEQELRAAQRRADSEVYEIIRQTRNRVRQIYEKAGIPVSEQFAPFVSS